MDDQRQRDVERGHAEQRCRFEAEGTVATATTRGALEGTPSLPKWRPLTAQSSPEGALDEWQAGRSRGTEQPLYTCVSSIAGGNG
jgi:hypothetical protein